MNVRFKPRFETVQQYLKTVPYGGLKVALKAFVEYVIGNASHGLKHPEPYKYVSREAAYGETFSSPKQRAYVMAKIRSGEITPGRSNRTGNSEEAWQYVMITDYNYTIVNPEPGAYWTRDDQGQANQPAMVGWRKTMAVVMDNMAGGMRAANAAVKKYFASKE